MRNIFRRTTAIITASMLAMMLMFAATAHAGDGTAALSMVPKDSMMVLSVNVDRLKGSPLYASAMAKVMAEPDAKGMISKLKADAGFDVEKDISTLVVSIPPDVDSSQNFLIIAEGKFNEQKIVAALGNEGAKVTSVKHANATYHEIDGQGGVAFMGNVAVFGTKDMVKAALSAKAGQADSIHAHPTMSKLVKSVDTNKDLWVSFELPDSLKKSMGGNPMINDLKSVTASVDIKSGLGLLVSIDTASDATATNLAQMMQAQVKAFAGAPEMKQMGFDVALQKLQVTGAGTAVSIALNLTPAEFKNVQQTIENLAKGAF